MSERLEESITEGIEINSSNKDSIGRAVERIPMVF